MVRENEKLKAESRANRSSVDGRLSNASGNSIMPKLGMGLANAVSSSFQGSAQGQLSTSKSKGNILKSKPGVLNQGSFGSQRPSLGSNLNVGMTQKPKGIPPQPYQFQKQLQLGNLQQINTRYGNSMNSGPSSGSAKRENQGGQVAELQTPDAHVLDASMEKQSPPLSQNNSAYMSGQYMQKQGLRTSSRYQVNNENF